MDFAAALGAKVINTNAALRERAEVSLSVDLEPIEVIMVTAVAPIQGYSQCSACQVPSFAYFPQLATDGD